MDLIQAIFAAPFDPSYVLGVRIWAGFMASVIVFTGFGATFSFIRWVRDTFHL